MDSIVPSLITGLSPLVVPLEPDALLVASDSVTRLNATPKSAARKDIFTELKVVVINLRVVADPD